MCGSVWMCVQRSFCSTTGILSNILIFQKLLLASLRELTRREGGAVSDKVLRLLSDDHPHDDVVSKINLQKINLQNKSSPATPKR